MDLTLVAPTAAVLSAAAAIVTVVINTLKSRAEAKKHQLELARKDAELREAAERHKQHLEQMARDTAQSLEHAAKLHAAEMKLAQYINITQRVFDLDHLFIQNPTLRPYFYEESIVQPDADVQRITALTEYILDFYSTLQEHESLLSDSSPSWQEWNVYIEDGFRSSPYLCHYFEQNASWYEEGLSTIYRKVAREKQEQVRRQRAALNLRQ